MAWKKSVAIAACLLAVAENAQANERHFGYTYETAVLPPDARELELWTTARVGRQSYYSRFDHRLELEAGVIPDLQTAFYINFTGLTAKNEAGKRVSSFAYKGVSSEWKWKISDPVADPVGFGLYGEVGVAPNEYELEAKLLFDKQWGDVLFAFNLVGEAEWELEEDETERKFVVEPVMGLSYLVTPAFGLGLEVRNQNEIEEGELEHSTLNAGPVLAFTLEGWWATLTILPQITDLKQGEVDDVSHEHAEIRLLFSSHL